MKPVHVALAAMVAVIWGFNFVLIHLGLGTMPPLVLAALRFVPAALLTLVLPRPAMSLGRFMAIASTLFVGQFGLLFIGMAHGMPPGLASLVLQAQAFFTAFIAAAVLKERPRVRQILGTTVALAGLVAVSSTAGADGVTVFGLGMTLAAAVAWATGNVLLRGAGAVEMLPAIAWLSLVPPLPLLALSAMIDGPDVMLRGIIAPGWVGILCVLYIAVLSTIVAYSLWGHLLKLYPASQVALFSLLVPVVGAGFAALTLGESFGPVRLLGMALILVGLAINTVPNPVTWWRRGALAAGA